MRQIGGGGFRKSKNNSRILVLLGAMGFAGVIVIISSLLLSGGSSDSTAKVVIEKQPEPETANVLIPVRQIETGEGLDPALFRVERRSKSSIPASVAQDFEQIRGMFARNTILMSEPVHLDLVTSIRPTNAITANIPEGYRAVTIRVDATSSVEGWARAGANVDVVWASMIRGKQAVTPIVQNARVLSAERQVSADTQPGVPVPSTVTLLVTADDAAKIQLATTTGSLSLSLRGDDDTGKGSSGSSITIDDLLGTKNQAEAVKSDGTVRIGGEEFYLRDGNLVPKEK